MVVVHGLDPATLSKTAQAEKSDLVPSLLGHVEPAWSLEQVQDILRRSDEEREAQKGDT